MFENLDLKTKVFAELDQVVKPDAILATNTSSLDIDKIAAATDRRENVLGVHFFSPANVMRLVELVKGGQSSPSTMATLLGVAKKLGKLGVIAGNCFGFIGNRMMRPYIREAQFLVEEGASVEQVNSALYDFGMAMGPLAMLDQIGLDVIWSIEEAARELESVDVRRPLVLKHLLDAVRLGQKSGSGWSTIDQRRKPVADPEVEQMIAQVATGAGICRREIGREEIVERCIFALINEGVRILEDGIARQPSDIDVVYLSGYGFPAWRGGPMFYANTLGTQAVFDKITGFERRFGPELWTPAPLLERLVTERRSLGSKAAEAA